MTIKQQIKEKMKERSITKAELSEKIGVSYSVLSRWLNDEKNINMTMKTLNRLAEAVDCTLYFVLEDNSNV